jgi:hypothetical protein
VFKESRYSCLLTLSPRKSKEEKLLGEAFLLAFPAFLEFSKEMGLY